jgi:hypothetical protein
LEQALSAHGHATRENKRVAILISVLASAALVTGVAPLIFVSIGVSIVGAALGAFGWLAPTLLHL